MDATLTLERWIDRARADKWFRDFETKFPTAGVMTWIQDREKALYYTIGAFLPGDGVIVEIGSWEGGSASFFASGVKRRGSGMVHCIDPHLGGPVWAGVAPNQRTLTKFTKHVEFLGLSKHIRPHIGDSVAVASVWPSVPVDAVLIDGDHSFLGAVRDFENWGPKVRPDGLILVDDANDEYQPGVIEAVEVFKRLRGVEFLGYVQGVAVFRRTNRSPWELLEELSVVHRSRGNVRPWDMRPVHAVGLPNGYLAAKDWANDPDEQVLDYSYQLAYFARCSHGHYGYTARSRLSDRRVLTALQRDRSDGQVELVGAGTGPYRAILCHPDEVAAVTPRLATGGVLIVRLSDGEPTPLESLHAHQRLCATPGVDGACFIKNFHWANWQPTYLSGEACVHFALQAAA